jgi:hypothetical protein
MTQTAPDQRRQFETAAEALLQHGFRDAST